jgi:hypothetical protein
MPGPALSILAHLLFYSAQPTFPPSLLHCYTVTGSRPSGPSSFPRMTRSRAGSPPRVATSPLTSESPAPGLLLVPSIAHPSRRWCQSRHAGAPRWLLSPMGRPRLPTRSPGANRARGYRILRSISPQIGVECGASLAAAQ